MFLTLNTKSKANLPSDSIRVMHVDENDNLWVGTEDSGLFILNISSNNVTTFAYDASEPSSICSNLINDILKDKSGNLWIATNNGLCKFNKKTNNFSQYIIESNRNSSLISNQIQTLYEDDGGVIWVGSINGINYWNASSRPFQHINTAVYPQLHSDDIISFAEAGNGDFYVGTLEAGISKYDYSENKLSKFKAELANKPIYAVPSLLVSSDNKLWVGTYNSGVYIHDLENNLISSYTTETNVSSDMSSVLSSNAISSMVESRTGQIIIGTYGGGVNIVNPDRSVVHLTASNKLSSNNVFDVIEDKEGNIWAGTMSGGLNKINLATGEVQVFKIDKENPHTIKSNSILGLLDTEDYLWMATKDAGVARLDKAKLKEGKVEFLHIGSEQGLASSFTYGVLEDENGRIWISHSKGLSRLNPVSLYSVNFNTSHGLQGNDFHSGSFFKSKSGRMFFGGPNGFNTFMPSDVTLNTYKPPVQLTKFSQSNSETPIHALFNKNGELVLEHDETVIDFEFAALDYTKPELNKYKYKMEGLSDIWLDLGTNNHISFSSLPDGFYKLKVKGSNNSGVWSDEVTIPIRVLPPLWRTWYAYLFYFLAAGALFLILVRQQQIKIQHQLANERKLHKLAYFDSLTGLPNRQSFYESMERFLSLAKRGKYKAGVMFIDLDRFKRINDTLGHNFGDKVLMQVAERLRQSVRNSDFVGRNYEVKSFKNEIARLGGDEFTVFLSHLDNADETANVTQRIIDSISEPITVDGYEVSVTPSIGIAMYPENGTSVQELMKHADVAMYQAKEGGRRTFKYYSNTLNDRALERLQLEEYMRAALQNDEFELYYQPQVDLKTNEITKAEALLRWTHPELGFVSPADFIPIAEESGIIIELGDWILQEACFQAREWHEAGLDIRVSVNVSSVQFKQTNLVDNVKNALELSELPKHLLELELTESAVMSDVEDNIGRLQMFKDMGIRIAVDDFGTGYSSLSYLKKFPIDTLKIDRSFIMDIDTNENDAAIVKAIMLLADTMQLNVVAEGVETLEQLRIIDNYGAQYIQGYFFSRPLPPAEFTKFVTEEFAEKSTWKLDLIG
ncbi:EAL domain-containing protein [Psychrosphaera haliotis]|uniref:EAL domain-containing protein n=1 Tax=Psychrosphaera haliotis TaxID=555083 RepID=UPI0018C6E668|nr:EAL domain-containing protein [Psychrosphaera haliotis]